jgi:L-ascorbate metabolism protein UlaG (beta-lactamase superfamily)
MAETELFLKPNVLMEPLFNQWYAWTYLIAPSTAAMYVTNLHLKIMKSFVSAPQIHVSALKNPAMIGGPFVHYSPDRVSEIKALLETTLQNQTHLFELSDAIHNLDLLLQEEAKGYSLESLYQRVPEPLRGYVELTYDLNNHPSFRLIEGLLYRSHYYRESSQSIALSLVEGDTRGFVFSTPRLEDSQILHNKLPFNRPEWDEFVRMKRHPKPLGYAMDLLKISSQDEALFARFFTETSPRSYQSYTDEAVRVRYFGHACISVESKDVCILIDPVISNDIDGASDRYTFLDLPDKIDYVLITHNHQDHCMLETLLQLRHRIQTLVVARNNGGTLADPSLKLILQQCGFKNVLEIDEMETVEVEQGGITGIPFLGEHADLNIRSKLAYLITLKGKKVLCVADSNNIEPKLYEHLHDLVNEIDILFIGMECEGGPLSWLYGPLLSKPLERRMDQSRRFDGSDYTKAMNLVEQMRPQQVYVYAMGQEPWLSYLTSIHYTEKSRPIIESNKLVADCQSRGIMAERLFGCREIHLS